MTLCAIFDMDGVIIDSEPVHMVCEREIFELLGITVTKDQHHAFSGTNDKEMWTKISDEFKLSLNVQDIISLKRSKYMELFKKDAQIEAIAGVRELIAELHSRGFSIVLASASPRPQIDFILSHFNLDTYFHARISGDDVAVGKPNPEIFLKAADLAHCSPGYCVVIEDSYNGVMAAKSAGMKCIGFINPNSGQQNLDHADIKVSSFSQLSVLLIEGLFTKPKL